MPLRVLLGANMPAILIEMGFLTNADDERALKGDRLAAIVDALVDTVAAVRRGVEGRIDARRRSMTPTPGPLPKSTVWAVLVGGIGLLTVGVWLVVSHLPSFLTTTEGGGPSTRVPAPTADARRITGDALLRGGGRP